VPLAILLLGMQAIQCLLTVSVSVDAYSISTSSYDIKPKDAHSLLLVLHDLGHSGIVVACFAH